MADPNHSKAIRIGMIGTGFMARVHSAGYALLSNIYGDDAPSFELVRISGSQQRAEAAAHRYGWQNWSSDWKEVALADDIDVVDIVTPNDMHCEPATAALGNGKRVLCEKPLATSYAEALKMVEAVPSGRSGIDGVCFVYRIWPLVEAARRIVMSGEIGEVISYRGFFLHDYMLDANAPWTWRLSKKAAGAGALGDIGSHAFDMARYIAGDIAEIMASTRTVAHKRPDAEGTLREIDVDDEARIILRFASGAEGTIEVSWLAAGTKMDLGFDVRGSKGAISFAWSRNNELRLYSHDDPANRRGFKTIVLGPALDGDDGLYGRLFGVPGLSIGYQEGFVVLLRRFLLPSEGQMPIPSFRDGAIASSYVLAAQQSAENRSWVRLPLANS